MIKIIKVKNYNKMSIEAAQIVLNQIKTNPNTILGLATGGTQEGLYNNLVHCKNHTSWKNIKTFNLDEYVGLHQEHPSSYRTYMNNKLFNHIDICKNNTHVPNGVGNIKQNALNYEKLIAQNGGIHLQILGIGENGHIAFNEPESDPDALTSKVQLTQSTISANCRYFNSIEEVPKEAITMGIGSILKAKQIILLASGKNKAQAIWNVIKGPITKKVPASFLQKHPNVTFIIDEEAALFLNT